MMRHRNIDHAVIVYAKMMLILNIVFAIVVYIETGRLW